MNHRDKLEDARLHPTWTRLDLSPDQKQKLLSMSPHHRNGPCVCWYEEFEGGYCLEAFRICEEDGKDVFELRNGLTQYPDFLTEILSGQLELV